MTSKVPPCLATNTNITRAKGSRSWLISERPKFGLTCPLPSDVLRDLIAWCAVEDVYRWRPNNGKTYCNIYAADLLHMLECYLPRQWWRNPYEAQLINERNGSPPPIVYGVNSFEMGANRLYGWALDYGPSFGLERVKSASELQELMNLSGQIGIMIKRRKSGNGHVTVCLPDSVDVSGSASGVGILQTQAGTTNKELFRDTPAKTRTSDDIFFGVYTGVRVQR